MELDLKDLFSNGVDKKTSRITIALDENDFQAIDELKRQIGRTTTCEIMRRAIRAGIKKAQSEFKNKAG
jgi:metal-responsive CopG/Arc/MetJ family transcriptional regulator